MQITTKIPHATFPELSVLTCLETVEMIEQHLRTISLVLLVLLNNKVGNGINHLNVNDNLLNKAYVYRVCITNRISRGRIQ